MPELDLGRFHIIVTYWNISAVLHLAWVPTWKWLPVQNSGGSPGGQAYPLAGPVPPYLFPSSCRAFTLAPAVPKFLLKRDPTGEEGSMEEVILFQYHRAACTTG